MYISVDMLLVNITCTDNCEFNLTSGLVTQAANRKSKDLIS